MEPSQQRISDMERHQVAEVLRQAAGEGRIDPEELDHRLEAAFTAKTYAELVPLTADLPATSAGHLPVQRPGQVVAGAAHQSSFAMMSTTRRRGPWQVGPQHRARAVMGGVVIDLREAILSSREVTIHASVVMGSVDVVVDERAVVICDGKAFMGDFSESRSRVEPRPQPDSPVVRVAGTRPHGPGERQAPAGPGSSGLSSASRLGAGPKYSAGAPPGGDAPALVEVVLLPRRFDGHAGLAEVDDRLDVRCRRAASPGGAITLMPCGVRVTMFFVMIATPGISIVFSPGSKLLLLALELDHADVGALDVALQVASGPDDVRLADDVLDQQVGLAELRHADAAELVATGLVVGLEPNWRLVRSRSSTPSAGGTLAMLLTRSSPSVPAQGIARAGSCRAGRRPRAGRTGRPSTGPPSARTSRPARAWPACGRSGPGCRTGSAG